ncbi:HAMP domain-containing protein, partial [Salmonella enterica]
QEKAITTAYDVHQYVIWASLAIALAVTLLVLALSALLVRSKTRPLATAVGLADAIAAGDLSRSIKAGGNDECAHLLQSLGNMQMSVSASSGQLSQGTHDLSSKTEE